jgi:hypothetical protein
VLTISTLNSLYWNMGYLHANATGLPLKVKPSLKHYLLSPFLLFVSSIDGKQARRRPNVFGVDLPCRAAPESPASLSSPLTSPPSLRPPLPTPFSSVCSPRPKKHLHRRCKKCHYRMLVLRVRYFSDLKRRQKLCLDLLIKKKRVVQLIYGKSGENQYSEALQTTHKTRKTHTLKTT